MSQIDTTFHISDLLVMGGALCTVIGFAARAIARAVQHRLAAIDRRLADHGRRLGDVEAHVQHHEAALQTLGMRRDGAAPRWRAHPEPDSVG